MSIRSSIVCQYCALPFRGPYGPYLTQASSVSLESGHCDQEKWFWNKKIRGEKKRGKTTRGCRGWGRKTLGVLEQRQAVKVAAQQVHPLSRARCSVQFRIKVSSRMNLEYTVASDRATGYIYIYLFTYCFWEYKFYSKSWQLFGTHLLPCIMYMFVCIYPNEGEGGQLKFQHESRTEHRGFKLSKIIVQESPN